MLIYISFFISYQKRKVLQVSSLFPRRIARVSF